SLRDLHPFPTRRSSDLLKYVGKFRSPPPSRNRRTGKYTPGSFVPALPRRGVRPATWQRKRSRAAIPWTFSDGAAAACFPGQRLRSEEHTSELQSREKLV